MKKQGKHPEWTIPDAGEAQKDILTKNQPQSKAIRDKLTEPDFSPEQHAPGKEPSMGHPTVPQYYGEAYKDIATKEAYDAGFMGKYAGLQDILCKVRDMTQV